MQALKNGIRFLLGLILRPLVPALFHLLEKLTALASQLYFFLDWNLSSNGNPQFFKHELNLYQWKYHPEKWSFSARGVFARSEMFKDCRVLDICCGDGSISYLFYSDIASQIFSIDNEATAISYAKENFKHPKITFQKNNLLKDELPQGPFDFVIWNAAISYFSEAEIDLVFKKIFQTCGQTFKLIGMVPKANGYIDHKKEFETKEVLEVFLKKYFSFVNVIEVDEGRAISFYFKCSN